MDVAFLKVTVADTNSSPVDRSNRKALGEATYRPNL
jgi:hypothetical protein